MLDTVEDPSVDASTDDVDSVVSDTASISSTLSARWKAFLKRKGIKAPKMKPAKFQSKGKSFLPPNTFIPPVETPVAKRESRDEAQERIYREVASYRASAPSDDTREEAPESNVKSIMSRYEPNTSVRSIMSRYEPNGPRKVKVSDNFTGRPKMRLKSPSFKKNVKAESVVPPPKTKRGMFEKFWTQSISSGANCLGATQSITSGTDCLGTGEKKEDSKSVHHDNSESIPHDNSESVFQVGPNEGGPNEGGPNEEGPNEGGPNETAEDLVICSPLSNDLTETIEDIARKGMEVASKALKDQAPMLKECDPASIGVMVTNESP